MAKRYYLGKLPDIYRGDNFPAINIISDNSLSGWTITANIVQWLGLVNRKTLTVQTISPTERRIDSFAGDIGPGSYGLLINFTSPSGYKTNTFEGSFNIVRTNKEIKTDESGITLNVEVLPNQTIQINVNLTGGGSPVPVSWGEVTDKPDFSEVATTGNYNDLSNKPNIPQEWFGTQAEYNAIDPKDPLIKYYIETEE